LIEALLEKVAQETSSPDKKKKIQHYLELIKMELSEQE
jgi:hypothetical protein